LLVFTTGAYAAGLAASVMLGSVRDARHRAEQPPHLGERRAACALDVPQRLAVLLKL
jgi:hypothetical protein